MRLLVLAGVAVGMIAFFVFFTGRVSHQDMTVLYSDLDIGDSSAIVGRLDDISINYTLSSDGDTILVPRSDVARARMSMAEAGLPSGGAMGYELFDQSSGLGANSFTQEINRLRALEGELARTIRTLGPVKSARVHLVLPKRELFSREAQAPSASIIVGLRGVGELSPNQVGAIRHVVASAVPKLSPNRISVVDSRGNLLARSDDQDTENGHLGVEGSTALKQNYEQRMAEAIERLLERTLGPGRVRAEVAVDMDFDRVTRNSEIFDPDGQVLRSTQYVTEESFANDGRPEDQAVTVDNNLPDGDMEQGGAGNRVRRDQRTEETTNYEISRTTEVHVRETGEVRRVSVAVMVDGVHETGADGETAYRERTPEELEKLAALVRSAVGYSENRGDHVELVSMRFATPDLGEEQPEEAGFLGLTKDDYMQLAELAAVAIVAILALLLVVRPAIGRILDAVDPEPSGGETDTPPALPAGQEAVGALTGPDGDAGPAYEDQQEDYDRAGNRLIDLGQVKGRIRESSLRQVSELIEQHPDESVGILRSWLYQHT